MRGLALLTILTLAVSATPAAADPVPPYLPKPTGDHPVGFTSLHLTDTSRPDPWVPEVDARELMVSLFYPATSSHGPKTRYMTAFESQALLEGFDLPPDLLTTTRTNSVRDARPAGRPHSLPLVVLSPGYTKPRATLSALAEDLASHGYVVAVVDHTYENVATTFPDGRVTTCASCAQPRNAAFWEKLVRGRAVDVSFVLDELTGPKPKWRGAHLVDPSRIAMGGHSVGGGSTVPTMLADTRIAAGIDIDGNSYFPIPDPGLSRPFLFLTKQPTGAPSPCADPNWQRDWPRLTGWKRWLSVTGAAHASFTDVGLLSDQAGLDYGSDVSADRVQAITRTYVRAFLDLHLRGDRRPLLDQPSTRYPEVVFCGATAVRTGR